MQVPTVLERKICEIQINHAISVGMNNNTFRQHLREELVGRCQKNPRYSQRAFARFLSVDHSTLAKLLNGKRPLGKKTVLRLGTKLGMSPSEIESHLSHQTTEATDSENYQKMADDTFQIIADWQHFAILELMRVQGFNGESKWIGRRLGISISEVNEALGRLERTEMIKKSGKEWFLAEDRKLTSLNPGTTTLAHRRLQKQILEKAITALEETDIEFRNQSSVTMAISTSLIPEAVKRIATFRRDLAGFLSRSKKCDEVYLLNVSLFPITNKKRSSL